MKADKRSPWREPMVWLVAAIPAMSFFAVGGLIWAANQGGGIDGVSDSVQRTGQIQTANTGPVENAAQNHLSAVIKFDGKRIEVFPASGNFDRSRDLILKLHHPVTASEDSTVPLKATLHGWAADFVLSTNHDWVVELLSDDGVWRLDGRWPAGQQATLLKPSITASQ